MYGPRADTLRTFRLARRAGRGPALRLLVLHQISARRSVKLAARSKRAAGAASLQIVRAAGQLALLRASQGSRGSRSYAFVRMRGGSQTHQVVPAVFHFSGRLAKGARRVSVVGPFNQWNPAVHPMTKRADGDWTITIYLPPGRVIYHFDVDGACWLDPADEGRVPNAWGTHYSSRELQPTFRRALSGAAQPAARLIRGGAQAADCGAEPVPASTDSAAPGALAVPRSAARGGTACSPSLEWRLEQRFEVRILHVRGEIDLATAAAFESAVREALEPGRSVVLSLRETGFLDSAGLYGLSRVRSQLPARGQRLVLADASRPVRRVIEIVGLDKSLPIFSSVEGALHYLIGAAQDAPRCAASTGSRD